MHRIHRVLLAGAAAVALSAFVAVYLLPHWMD